MVFIVLIALLLCTIGACVAFTVKIFELQSEITTLKKSQDCASDLETTRQEISYNFSSYNSGTEQALSNVIQILYLNLSRALEIEFNMLQEQMAHNYSDYEATFQQLYRNLSQDTVLYRLI